MGTKRIFTKEETELMIKMYRNGETYSCISKIIKTKPSKISEHLSAFCALRRSQMRFGTAVLLRKPGR